MYVSPDAFQKSTDGSDFYIAVFAEGMDTVLFATYYGNSKVGEHVDGGTSRFDKNGIVYQSVCGSCGYTTYPAPDPVTTPGAWSRVNSGRRAYDTSAHGCNNLVLKLDVRVTDVEAKFLAPEYACAGDATPAVVRFVNASKKAKTYAWDFGDGTTSQNADAVHLYDDTGTFIVRLVAFNPTSCSLSDTFYQPVTIIRHSDASFKIDTIACDGTVALTATGTAGEYIWSFGDGFTGKGSKIFHKYAKAGTYIIRLYTDNGTLCVDSSKQTVNISFPKGNFSYTIDTCRMLVTFQNKSSAASFYTWDFGDNTYDTVENPVHTYKKANTLYHITLTLTDPRGCIMEYTDSLIIKNELSASYTFKQDTCTGKVIFNNLSKHAARFSWDFGDGTTDTVKNPVHYFTKDSLYTVRLIATADGGCPDTVLHLVNGYRQPHGKFVFEKDSCTSDVKFKSEVFRGYRADWDFGDGSPVNHEWNPKHTYDKKGTYTVRFIMNSGGTCADTFVQEVRITNDKPSPIDVPNVFTPNDDSKNDVFIVEGNTLCYRFEIEIYNRWGQLVFKEEGNPLRWDGLSIQGHKLPPGVYYYIFRDPTFGERHGTVTLLRE
jgi:gliding motility-associated-like protein